MNSFEVGGKYNIVVFESKIYSKINEIKIEPNILDEVFYNNKNKIDGSYMFIVKDNKFIIAPYKNPLNNNNFWDYGHADLANLENIDFAWDISFKNWKIIDFTNQSGHYLPHSSDKNILVDILEPNYNLDINLFYNAD